MSKVNAEIKNLISEARKARNVSQENMLQQIKCLESQRQKFLFETNEECAKEIINAIKEGLSKAPQPSGNNSQDLLSNSRLYILLIDKIQDSIIRIVNNINDLEKKLIENSAEHNFQDYIEVRNQNIEKIQFWKKSLLSSIESINNLYGRAVDKVIAVSENNSEYSAPKTHAETEVDNKIHFFESILQVECRKANKFFDRKQEEVRCLVPLRNGVYYEDTKVWREALWDNYYTSAPEQQRIPVERYNYIKRA